MPVVLSPHLNAELRLSTFSGDLAAVTRDQCLEVLQHTYSELGFNEIRSKLGGRLYPHTTNGHHDTNMWTVQIKLPETDCLNLSHEFDTEAALIVDRITDANGKILRTKNSEMLRIDPIHMDIAIAVGKVQSASGVDKPS